MGPRRLSLIRGTSVACLWSAVLSACAKPLPPPVIPQLSQAQVAIVRAYTGCWALTFDRPFPAAGIGTSVVVALDSTVIGADPAGPALSAHGLVGFTNGRTAPFHLVWQPRLPPDTTYLAIQSTSGVGWRLWLADDSLSGHSFEFWDLGPTETDAGSLTGRRVPCPESSSGYPHAA